jgi:hypothetical protein
MEDGNDRYYYNQVVINAQDLELIKETGGHVPQNKRETLTKIIQLEKGNFLSF